MENQILSEQFKRMQKLAGIIDESFLEAPSFNEIKENLDAKYDRIKDYKYAVKSKYVIGLGGREDKKYFRTEKAATDYVKAKPEMREYIGIEAAKPKMREYIGIEDEIEEGNYKKTAEVQNIEKLFNQPTLKNALFQINTEQEYKDVIAALHLHFPDAFKKNMSVQAVGTGLKLGIEPPASYSTLK